MKKIIGIFLLLSSLSMAVTDNTATDSGSTTTDGSIGVIIPDDNIPIIPEEITKPDGTPGWQIPMIPLEPAMPITKEPDAEGRKIEKNFRILLDERVEVHVPLEVITDIDMNVNVIDDEVVRVPFEIELNKTPDKQNYYSLKYSENTLDIDGDGAFDTYIFSPKYINDKKEVNNYVEIDGRGITQEGVYKKTVYITVEVGETEINKDTI